MLSAGIQPQGVESVIADHNCSPREAKLPEKNRKCDTNG